MIDIEYIRKMYHLEGWSIRKLSRNLGHARQTIRKVVNNSQIPKYDLKKPRSFPVMDPYRDVIQEWLDNDKSAPKKQRHTAKRIYDRLVEEYMFTGSESSVRKFVRKLRPKYQEVYIPLMAQWGEQAQVDWGRAKVIIGNQLTEVCLFCLKMRASRVPFVWAFPTERLEAFLEGHQFAFRWLGGVPKELVYDNPKTAVVRILQGPYREEHTIFSSLKSHYLFDGIFCNASQPHEKGSIENLVGYVRRNTMVPVPQVPSIDSLNIHLIAWCEKEKQRYSEEWKKEKEGLLPLPKSLYRCSVTKMARVSSYSLVTYDRVRYSVPCRHIKLTLRLEVFSDRIEIWDHSRLLATHKRSYVRQETVLELAHYLDVLERKPRAVMNAQVVRELPEIYSKAKEVLLKDNREGYREFCQILLLHRDHCKEQVNAALTKAVEMEKVDSSTVRQWLINNNGVSKPRKEVKVPIELKEYQTSQVDNSRYDQLLEVT